MPITNSQNLTDGDRLYEGQIANIIDATILSGINADSQILVGGRGLVDFAGDRNFGLPVDGNSIFRGVVVKPDVIEKKAGYSLNADGDFGWPLQHIVSYLVRGTIGVRVDTAVTDTDPVYLIHTPAGAERKGRWRGSASAGSILIPATSARWLRAGAAGSVVPLLVSLV